MKMSKPGLCCDECFSMLAKQDTLAARIWLDLCELHLHSPIFGLLMEDNESLRLLELLGYITTTDTEYVIKVKVHGFHANGDDSYYCGGRCGRD